MNLHSMHVELDRPVMSRAGRLVIKMMLSSDGEHYWRKWEVALPELPDDPREAWEVLRSTIAAIQPQPVNADTSIRDVTQRIQPSSVLGRALAFMGRQ